jgi:hypothetical protein
MQNFYFLKCGSLKLYLCANLVGQQGNRTAAVKLCQPSREAFSRKTI